MQKKISILVPCCNVEQYVRECLESIRGQTYVNIEVICIDDGSTDSTPEIIDEYVKKDSRFIAIHKANSGYGDSMNLGLERCTGDYVGIVESDDWIEPNMYAVLMDNAEKYNLDISRCNWLEGPTGTEHKYIQGTTRTDVVCCPMNEKKVFFQKASIWASLYRRELLEEGRKVRFLPTPGASYQDTSFAFKVYTKCKRLLITDFCLYHYRINPNSSVSSSGKIFCVSDEWEEMIRWVVSDQELKKAFSKTTLFPQICYGGFIWNLRRLSTLPQLRFLHRACVVFRQASGLGIFNLSYFHKRKKCAVLRMVMSDPLAFYEKWTFDKLKTLYKKGIQIKKRKSEENLISIIVSIDNAAKYLSLSLRSVMLQDYKNLEIICVDDASSDESAILVRHFMRKDKRISLLKTDFTVGASVARNLAIEKCRGKYLMFLDAEDILLPGAVGHLNANMIDDVDVVAGNMDIAHESERNRYDFLIEKTHHCRIRKACLYKYNECITQNQRLNENPYAKLWRMAVIRRYNIKFSNANSKNDTSFFWDYISVAPHIRTTVQSVYAFRHFTTQS